MQESASGTSDIPIVETKSRWTESLSVERKTVAVYRRHDRIVTHACICTECVYLEAIIVGGNYNWIIIIFKFVVP